MKMIWNPHWSEIRHLNIVKTLTNSIIYAFQLLTMIHPHIRSLRLISILLVIFGPIINHVKVLYGQFDPVLDVPRSINSSKLDQLGAYRKARKASDERLNH